MALAPAPPTGKSRAPRLRAWPQAGLGGSADYVLRTMAFDEEFMAQHGYTSVNAMAIEAGVHLSMFSRIRSGEVALHGKGIVAIMAAYKGVSFNELFYLEAVPQPELVPRRQLKGCTPARGNVTITEP